MEGFEGGCRSFSVSPVPLFVFFRINTGHHFCALGSQWDIFPKLMTRRSFSTVQLSQRSAGPGMGPEVSTLPAHSRGGST